MNMCLPEWSGPRPSAARVKGPRFRSQTFKEQALLWRCLRTPGLGDREGDDLVTSAPAHQGAEHLALPPEDSRQSRRGMDAEGEVAFPAALERQGEPDIGGWKHLTQKNPAGRVAIGDQGHPAPGHRSHRTTGEPETHHRQIQNADGGSLCAELLLEYLRHALIEIQSK